MQTFLRNFKTFGTRLFGKLGLWAPAGRWAWLRRRRTAVAAVLVAGAVVCWVLLGSDRPGSSLPPEQAASHTEAAGNPLKGLESLAGQNDVWLTESQRSRQWQVAKMSALGKMIRAFPAVEQAAVLLDIGSPRRLGRPGQPATAVANVSLRPGHDMTPALLRAIVDLVAGGVAGLDVAAVSVVDSRGRSYRLDEQQAAAAANETLQHLAPVEEYYRSKILVALKHIPGLVAVIRADIDGSSWKCRSAVVSVPQRSQTLADPPAGGTESQSEPLAAQADRIREVVCTITGLALADVNVNWIPNRLQQREIEPALAETTAVEPRRSIWAWVGWGLLLAGLAGAGVSLGIRRIRRRRRRLAWMRVRAVARRRQYRTSAVVREARPRDIQPGFEDLAQMPPDRLAAVLEGLSAGELAVALRTTGHRLQKQVLSTLSDRKAHEVRRQMQRIGPVRLSQVDSARQQVLEAVREYEAGQQTVAATGGGERIA